MSETTSCPLCGKADVDVTKSAGGLLRHFVCESCGYDFWSTQLSIENAREHAYGSSTSSSISMSEIRDHARALEQEEQMAELLGIENWGDLHVATNSARCPNCGATDFTILVEWDSFGRPGQQYGMCKRCGRRGKLY
jgi:DNA-directed RNA polymerase subunit M/transcription elongation factor TFIIS